VKYAMTSAPNSITRSSWLSATTFAGDTAPPGLYVTSGAQPARATVMPVIAQTCCQAFITFLRKMRGKVERKPSYKISLRL